MTQDDRDLDWSKQIASLVVDALIAGNVLSKTTSRAEFERAVTIAADRIRTHLASGNLPDQEPRP